MKLEKIMEIKALVCYEIEHGFVGSLSFSYVKSKIVIP